MVLQKDYKKKIEIIIWLLRFDYTIHLFDGRWNEKNKCIRRSVSFSPFQVKRRKKQKNKSEMRMIGKYNVFMLVKCLNIREENRKTYGNPYDLRRNLPNTLLKQWFWYVTCVKYIHLFGSNIYISQRRQYFFKGKH